MKVKLKSLVNALCMTDSEIAMEVQKMSGQIITRKLISNAIDGLPIPALKAQALCDWLSKEFGRKIGPEDISDLKIHSFSSLPVSADTGRESIAFREERIEGFLAGFNLAFTAQSQNRTLSNQEVHALAEQATSKRLKVFQESAGHVAPLRNRDAYKHACAFAAIGLEAIFSRPGGAQKYAEWKSWLPVQREQYAREMAEVYLKYL